MAGDDGSRSDLRSSALSLDELSPKPKQATESARWPALVASGADRSGDHQGAAGLPSESGGAAGR